MSVHFVFLFSYNYLNTCFFFFSSRRRHTRFDCDWSSDVCSSDLPACGRRNVPGAPVVATFCRLEIGDTAGWKPALRQTGRTLPMGLRRVGFNGLSFFENSGSACMELLQMFSKLRRIKVWQRLYILEKMIEKRT